MIEPECIFVPYPNLNTEDKERVQFRDFLVSKNGVTVFNTDGDFAKPKSEIEHSNIRGAKQAVDR